MRAAVTLFSGRLAMPQGQSQSQDPGCLMSGICLTGHHPALPTALSRDPTVQKEKCTLKE